jgi:hypothetical protein
MRKEVAVFKAVAASRPLTLLLDVVDERELTAVSSMWRAVSEGAERMDCNFIEEP